MTAHYRSKRRTQKSKIKEEIARSEKQQQQKNRYFSGATTNFFYLQRVFWTLKWQFKRWRFTAIFINAILVLFSFCFSRFFIEKMTFSFKNVHENKILLSFSTDKNCNLWRNRRFFFLISIFWTENWVFITYDFHKKIVKIQNFSFEAISFASIIKKI